MNRRGFLSAILAAGVAPAVVRAASLMPVRVLDSGVVTLVNDLIIPSAPRILVDGVPLASHILTKPLTCKDLIIEPGATLITAYHPVYVEGCLTNDGEIKCRSPSNRSTH